MRNPVLDNWKVILSLRDSGIEPLRNWLGDICTNTPIGTVDVGPLNEEEASELGKAKPHLKSLLFGSKSVREIVRRPFFAKILDQNFIARTGDSTFLPQSEIDIIHNWWARGGYDSEGATAFARQQAILDLGRIRARHLEQEIAVGQLGQKTVELVDQLVADGILQHVRPGHTVRFSHDIYFEWSFLQVLMGRGANWLEEVKLCGEPPAVARVVELLSQSEFGNGSSWTEHLLQVDRSQMRSQWTRSWLLAPVSASDFGNAESFYRDALQADDFRFLEKALVWFQAERTTPNANILAGDMAADQRIRLADLLGWPADLATWSRFIVFILQQLADVPVSFYPSILTIFEVWQNAFSLQKNQISNVIVQWLAHWLTGMETEPKGYQPDAPASKWSALGSDLTSFRRETRSLLLRSAISEPEFADTYLRTVIGSDNLGDRKFGQVVAFSPILARSHPDLLVELTLRHLRDELPQDAEDRQREQDRSSSAARATIRAKAPEDRTEREEKFLSRPSFPRGLQAISHHDWQSLALDRDSQNYFPPSPLREPFHSLFKFAPDEAIRLLAQLSNHAILAWRQLHRLDRQQQGTPIPLVLRFPWGEQIFWGGTREYLWSRGMWAPPAIASGYMALEDWALTESESGKPLDDLLKQITVGAECIAILGTAAAISLQSWCPTEAAFTLVTSQKLLSADQERFRQDFGSSQANLIGFNFETDSSHIQAVSQANKRPARNRQLHYLIPLFFLPNNTETSGRIKSAVESFPENLPFELEEHRNSDDAKNYLTKQAREFAELVDIANYEAQAANGTQIAIIHNSPSANTPENAAKVEIARQRLTESGLWAWAKNALDTGELGESLSLSRAIDLAKAAAKPKLFESNNGDQLELDMCRGAVAATAALALKRRDEITHSDVQWARHTLGRAFSAPETIDTFRSSMSELPWHSGIFVSVGIADDLAHGTANEDSSVALLTLVAHPLDCVATAAFKAAFSVWKKEPKLGWSALFLALRLRIVPPPPAQSTISWSYQAVAERASSLAAAYAIYRGNTSWPPLPYPPPPWIKTDNAPDSLEIDDLEQDLIDDGVADINEAWAPSPIRWDSAHAAKVIAVIPYAEIMSSPARGELLNWLEHQLEWTLAKLSPPWAASRRGRRDSPSIFEWSHAIGRAIGRVAGHMPLEDVRIRFLEPIFALDGEQCWELLSPMVNTYICVHVLDAMEIPAEATVFLMKCLDRFLSDKAFDPASYRAGKLSGFDQPRLAEALMFVSVKHAEQAARYVNGDWSDIARILPIVDRFMHAAGWSSIIMQHYLTLCERSRDSFPADIFAKHILHVIGRPFTSLNGWRGTMLPARIAGLVQFFADRETPMQAALGQSFLRILDMLVDMGDRRSAALQSSETFREIQTH